MVGIVHRNSRRSTRIPFLWAVLCRPAANAAAGSIAVGGGGVCGPRCYNPGMVLRTRRRDGPCCQAGRVTLAARLFETPTRNGNLQLVAPTREGTTVNSGETE